MMGLFSSSTILRESVDEYYDKYNLQDLQLYSSYGFCEEDIKALKENEDIDKVFPSKTIDVYATKNFKDNIVVRVEELQRNINEYELIEGRMPRSKTEALILVNAEQFKNALSPIELTPSSRLTIRSFFIFLNTSLPIPTT